jgi:tetratricopeptide (TPR) repeat protein
MRTSRRIAQLCSLFALARPNEVQEKVNLGAALAHIGQFDEAIATYRSALPLLQDKDPVLLNLALAYYKKGDFENARQQFEVLHDARPEDVRVIICWRSAICDEDDVGVAVIVEVTEVQAHAGDEAAIFSKRDARFERNFLELVAQIMEEGVVRGIVRDEDVGSAIEIVICHATTHAFSHMVAQSPFFGNIPEGAVAIVQKELIGLSLVELRLQ